MHFFGSFTFILLIKCSVRLEIFLVLLSNTKEVYMLTLHVANLFMALVQVLHKPMKDESLTTIV
jgi:hypothetical protein